MIRRAMLAAGTATEVVVPIVTAILGLIGGFLPAWYTARQQRRAQRRSYARERADELAARLGGAREAVRHALDGRPSQKAIDDANWLVGEVAGGLPSARLRLSSEAGDAAKAAVDGLRRAVQLLADEDRSLDDARAAYEQASAAEDAFVRAVRGELGED